MYINTKKMLYILCPTCRNLLGNKQKYYERKLMEIQQKYDMKKYKTYNEMENDKINLVNSLGLRRYCCKQRLLTYVNCVDVVK